MLTNQSTCLPSKRRRENRPPPISRTIKWPLSPRLHAKGFSLLPPSLLRVYLSMKSYIKARAKERRRRENVADWSTLILKALLPLSSFSSLLFFFVPIPHLPFLPRQNQGTAGGGSVVPCTNAHTTLWARDVCEEEKDGGGKILDIRAPSPTVHYTQAYTMPGKSVKKKAFLFVRQVPSQTPRDDDLSRYVIFFPRRNIILEEKCFGARRVGPIARAMTSLRGKSTFGPGGPPAVGQIANAGAIAHFAIPMTIDGRI